MAKEGGVFPSLCFDKNKASGKPSCQYNAIRQSKTWARCNQVNQEDVDRNPKCFGHGGGGVGYEKIIQFRHC